MQIFLSYASEDRLIAEEIQLALLGSGHNVFFDKASLPAGGDYHTRIEAAIKQSDLFIFLISLNSVTPGSYALTELKFARSKWPHPKGRVLPVRLYETDWKTIPPYLKSVTVLEPEGNIPAEIVAAAIELERISTSLKIPGGSKLSSSGHSNENNTPDKSNSVQIWVAVIGLASAIGVALITNWQNVFQYYSAEVPSIPLSGLKGADTGNAQTQTLNVECPEITEYDYSKFPTESKVVRRCSPQ